MIIEFEAKKLSSEKDANNFSSLEKIKKDKFRNFRLLGHCQKLLFDAEVANTTGQGIHRTRLCHAARSYNAQSIKITMPVDASKNAAYLRGVQTCGSVWSCPVCARKIAAQRGEEVSRAIDYMIEAGYLPIMLTFTARHILEFRLEFFKQKFKAAHLFFVKHRRWQSLKAMMGAEYSIKAVEGTWGYEHGWHYHQHVILFLHADAFALFSEEDFQEWIGIARDLWMDALESQGLDGIPEIAFDVQASGDIKKKYLAKLGLEDETSNLDYELTAGHNKTSGGAKIWQILERSWQGDQQMGALFVEWVEAMSGDKWITWTPGLKALCGINDISDEEAAEAFDGLDNEETELLVEIEDEDFAPVRKMYLVADLLELSAKTRNAEIVLAWLAEMKIKWNNSGAAKERERLEAQYRALDEKLANLRKGYNKRGEHPAPDSEFWRMADQLKQLKIRLGIK